jgi:hypothetical protein
MLHLRVGVLLDHSPATVLIDRPPQIVVYFLEFLIIIQNDNTLLKPTVESSEQTPNDNANMAQYALLPSAR